MISIKSSPIARPFVRKARRTGILVAVALAGLYTVACDVHGPSGPGDLSSITVSPNPQVLAGNGTQQFTAVGTDFDGTAVTFTPVWTVTAGGGTISATGMFTAGGVSGTFTNTVQASAEGLQGTATVTVTIGSLATIAITPNPATLGVSLTQQFSAVGMDAGGNIVAITPVWSIENGGGTIGDDGLFTANSVPGTYTNTIMVTSGGVSATATVTVTAGALATIEVTPTPASLAVGAMQQFTAVGKDMGGNVVSINPVWSVVNGGGTIDASTGDFTAGTTTGSFDNTIQATSGAVSGFATVNVTTAAAALSSITVTPSPTSMLTGTTQQFAAEGRDGGGSIVPISPVWTVDNGGGTIDANTGLFTASALAGTFNNTVVATSGAISGTATVTVTLTVPPPPGPLVDLGAAALNGIMAGQAVTCVSLGIINADVAVSPGNTVTGFGGACTITGVQHLADAVALQGQVDLTAAYNELAGMPCAPANAIVADLGGTTKPAGVYCTASSIGVTGTLTLDGGGDPNATFVFQAGTSLITAGNIVLIGGAQANNVYWQVGTSATLGTASQWQGNILVLTSITLVDNATLLGRALARNGSVSLGTNNVINLP